MGFSSLVYGNIKGFHNTNPTREEMEYWSQRQRYSLSSVTSFTDGTKLQIEQCLVANGLNASIACQGLTGERISDMKTGAFSLAQKATDLKQVLSDYIISAEAPPGVFIVGTHHEELAPNLKTYKMGDGPFYLHYKPTHLCFFETQKPLSASTTIRKYCSTMAPNQLWVWQPLPNRFYCPEQLWRAVSAPLKPEVKPSIFVTKGTWSPLGS
jgi:predicted homoserine dehydrogenase-like protein